jgi:hypothetical protein
MSIQQCKSCNGVYATKQLDGGLYAHACPSTIPPANARNENPPSTQATDTAKIISAGLGTQPPATIPPSLAALTNL